MQLSETFVTTLDELASQRRAAHGLYFEFLRVPAMSAGLYELNAGAPDPQTPHSEDEVYYVVRGRGQIRIGERDHPATEGSVIFVPAGVEHRFHSIESDLSVLVFFAPAESSG